MKAGVAVTNQKDFATGGLELPSNPYYGLAVGNSTQFRGAGHRKEAERSFVNRGCRGPREFGSQAFISGQTRGMNARLKNLLKRRRALEPIIGHMKKDGMLGCNCLNSTR